MAVPTAAVPNTVAVLPAADCKRAPTAGPVTTLTGVAAATCAEVPARSNTVSQRRVAAAASLGRISVRHILFRVVVSVEKLSVVTNRAFAGSMVVIDPANGPFNTSKRCKPVPGDATSTGLAGK